VVSNFAITIGTICAERLLYLPSAGVLMAAAAGAARLSTTGTTRRYVVLIAVASLIAAGGARTWVRNRDWMSDRSLWTSAIAVAPQSASVQSEYGRVQMEQAQAEADAGRQSEAERLFSSAREHFETSLRIYPSYSASMDGLATILAEHQQYDEALTLYERAVRVWPSNYASVTNWAGLLWDRSRRLEESANQLRGDGRAAEADAAMRESDAGFRQALDKVDQAIHMRSSYAHAHLIRALLLDGYVRDAAGAIAEFETVLRLQPDNPQRALIERELSRLRAQPSGGPAGSGGPTPEQPH
jgi:tetratricopeptide (TPR) repeat protein